MNITRRLSQCDENRKEGKKEGKEEGRQNEFELLSQDLQKEKLQLTDIGRVSGGIGYAMNVCVPLKFKC